jgi:hypothetical protein
MLDIFTFDRVGTPITEEERTKIEQELDALRVSLTDTASLQREAAHLTEITGIQWSTEWVVITIEADIWGHEETLRTGVVTVW